MRIAGLLAFVVMLSSIGIACLFFSREIQSFAVRWADRGINSRLPLVKRFTQSASYLISVKAVGVIAILCAIFLLWAFIHNLRVAE